MRNLKQLPAPPTRGLMGHLYYLKKDNVHRQMLAWSYKYGLLYQLRVGLKRALVIADTPLIREVLKGRPQDFRRIRNIESVLDDIGMNGVFSSEGERWKYQRSIINILFQPNHLKEFFPNMQRITRRFCARMDYLSMESRCVYIADEFKSYTVDVTTLLALGEDTNAAACAGNPLSSSLQALFPVINERCRSPLPLWLLYRSAKDKTFDAGLAQVKETLRGFIAGQRTRLQQAPMKEPENSLQLMLREQEKNGVLTDGDIIANALTLLLAGEETTANTLAWIVYLISLRPEVEEKLQAELAQYPKDAYGVLTWPLPKMPWLTAIMYESMRLKPVVPLLCMESLYNTSVGGVRINKGAPIFLAMNASGFVDSKFKDAGSFLPERWFTREEDALSTLMPFGSGPRLCPGRSLAIMEIKLVLCALYSNYRITAQQSPSTVRERFAFTMAPQYFKVKIQRRR